MNLEDMNLEQVTKELDTLDEQVRKATKIEDVEVAAERRQGLLDRKAELETLEERKDKILALEAGAVVPQIIETRGETKMNFDGMTPIEVRSTQEYRNAFLKTLQGKPLTEVEQRANEIASKDAVGVMAQTTSDKIFNKLKEIAPLLTEVELLRVPGAVKFGVQNVNNDATLHTENAVQGAAADVLDTVSLNAYEIMKLISISAIVQKMSVNTFEAWLVDKLAEAVLVKAGDLLIYGTGSSQPKGVDYARTWTDKSTAIQWAGADPTANELISLIGLLKAGYHKRAKFLMNRQTMWVHLAKIRDDSKYPILNPEMDRLFGYPILFDDNVAAGDIFFGDFKKIVANLADDIKVEASAAAGFTSNSVLYRATAIFDCTVAVPEAFVKTAKVLTAGK